MHMKLAKPRPCTGETFVCNDCGQTVLMSAARPHREIMCPALKGSPAPPRPANFSGRDPSPADVMERRPPYSQTRLGELQNFQGEYVTHPKVWPADIHSRARMEPASHGFDTSTGYISPTPTPALNSPSFCTGPGVGHTLTCT